MRVQSDTSHPIDWVYFGLTALGLSILSMAFLRFFLLTPGAVGHNWDWYIPSLPAYLRSGLLEIFSSWSEHSLGHPEYIGRALVYAPFYALGFLGIGGDVVSKLILLGTPIVSGSFAHLTILDGLEENSSRAKASATIGGILYGFSGATFQWLLAGSLPALAGFCLIPLAIFASHRWLTKLQTASSIPVEQTVFLSLVLSLLVFISLPNFLVSCAILLLYMLFSPTRRKKTVLYSLGLVAVITGVSSTFSFVPYLWYSYSVPQLVDLSSKSLNYNFSPALLPSFVVAGFYARDMYLRSVAALLLPVFQLCSYGMVAIVVGFVWIRGKAAGRDVSRLGAIWALVFALALGLSVGDKVLGPVVRAFYSFPPSIILRSFQYYVGYVSLALAFLFAILFHRVPRLVIGRRPRLLVSALLLILISGYLTPWFTGDLGASLRQTDFDGTLDVFRTPSDYTSAFTMLSSDSGSFNILALPMTASPYYSPTNYQRTGYPNQNSSYEGPEPTLLNSNHGVLTYDDTFASTMQSRDMLLDLASHFNSQNMAAKSNMSSLTDNNFTDFWNVHLVGTGNYGYLASISSSNLVNGTGSYEVRQIQGSFQSAYLSHTFSTLQNWLAFAGVSLYFYGRNDGQVYTLELMAPDPNNRLLFRFTDDFQGWKLLSFDFNNPYASVGSPDTNTITQVQLYNFFAGAWYLGSLSLYSYVKMTSDQVRLSFLWVLHFLDVKYIVLLKSVSPTTLWNATKTQDFLTGILTLNTLIDGPSTALYLLPLPYQGSRLYTAQQLTCVNDYGVNDPLVHLAQQGLSFGDSAVVADFPTCPAPHPAGLTSITVTQESSSEYHVTTNATEPFMLVLSQQYNPLWKVYVQPNGRPLPESSHFLANGYANGWYLNLTGTEQLKVAFELQPVFDISAAISIVAIMSQLIALIIMRIKPPRRHEDQEKDNRTEESSRLRMMPIQ